MFAFVKKLFGKPQPAAVSSSRPVGSVPAMAARPHPTSPHVSPAPRPEIKPVFGPNGSAQDAAAPAAPSPAPTKVRPAPSEPVFSKETVDICLKQLWPKLGPEIAQHGQRKPSADDSLRLPLNLVQAQLAKGNMKIPFVQLRRFSPEGLFSADPAFDTVEVLLPICEILPRLKPADLPRRAGQRKVEVPDDIGSIFGPDSAKNGALRLGQAKPRTAPADERKEPAPVNEPTALPEAPEPSIRPIATALPPASGPVPAPLPVAPPVRIPPRTIEPISSEPIRAPKVDPSLASLRAKPPERTLIIALMDIASFWSDRGQKDLENLYRHSVAIPFSALEAALKKGKVEFAWREVRPWIRLATGQGLPSLGEETKVEFPLSVIAPRFLEEQGKATPKKQVRIGDEIPDIFVRNTPPPPPLPVAVALAGGNETEARKRDYGEIFGQPEKKEWSLGEVTERTTTLPGVAGAVIATSDGLLVGGTWPGAGGEAVAAFAPQMYSRMSGYMKELKLGDPGNFTLLIENVSLKIFKSADSFFTVLGRPGEELPSKELTAIATRLAASAFEN